MNPAMKSLKKSFETVMDELSNKIDSVSWQDQQSYAFWLAQTYYYVCHSTRLLALAASRFTVKDKELHSRFLEHLKEEKGHEFLALRDLEALGYKISDIPEHPATSAMYTSQYYWIEHVHPLAFFGYIIGLEGLAVRRCGYINDETKKAFGEKPTSFARVHAGEDVGHIEQAFKMIEKLPPEVLPLIEKNLLEFSWNYSGVLSHMAAAERKVLTLLPGKAA